MAHRKRPSFAVRLRSAELALELHLENLRMQIEYTGKGLEKQLKELATEAAGREHRRKRK